MVESKHKSIPPSVSLISGGIAGGVEGFLTYPFEFAKTRLQLAKRSPTTTSHPKPSRNPYLIIHRIYTQEGLLALYKGCPSLVLGSIGKDALRFVSFDSIKNAFRDPSTGTLSPARNLAAGMAAGVVASLGAVTPTERIKTALIDDASKPASKGGRRFRGGVHCVRCIVHEDGLKGLYRGLVGTTLKQASATGLRMGSYNILKDFQVQRGIEQSTAVNFANGAVAGVTTTLLSMPFDTVKTVSQSAERTTTVQAVRRIWSDGGVRAFWRGTVLRLSRTVFSGGILFTTAEAVSKIITPMVVSQDELTETL